MNFKDIMYTILCPIIGLVGLIYIFILLIPFIVLFSGLFGIIILFVVVLTLIAKLQLLVIKIKEKRKKGDD